MSEQALVEGVLKSTIEDRDRDKSDAKDAVLEVASLIASDESLNRLVSAMRKSRYEHFRTAAREFRGRRETILRFLDRAGAVEVDGHPACDVGFGDILSVGQKMASDILDARRNPPYHGHEAISEGHCGSRASISGRWRQVFRPQRRLKCLMRR